MPKAPCRARFRTVVDLRASRRWRFRYVLDGERWENDWAADDYLPNSHGADDSVVDPPISRPSRWPRSPPADEAGNAGGVDARPRWTRWRRRACRPGRGGPPPRVPGHASGPPPPRRRRDTGGEGRADGEAAGGCAGAASQGVRPAGDHAEEAGHARRVDRRVPAGERGDAVRWGPWPYRGADHVQAELSVLLAADTRDPFRAGGLRCHRARGPVAGWIRRVAEPAG